MPLPQNHPQRFDLNHELHARPFAELQAPARASYLALLAALGVRHIRKAVSREGGR